MSNEFLDDLFGDQEGTVYSPTMGKRWKQHFFQWPQESQKLEVHIKNYHDQDVYLSPALFTEPKVSRETFKGTNYLWADFDGSVPTADVIEPTLKVSSSIEGHEHWYWRLDKFLTDKILVEDLTRRIAYHYQADLGTWDYARVLRPPDTWNHKRNKPVTVVRKTNQVYTVDKFLWVPIPPAGTTVDIKLGSLPEFEGILAKYKWTYDARDLLTKVVNEGRRSDALARLAHECAEIGLSNEEIYVVLEARDRAWGKFVGRSDRQKRLEDFIIKVRGKRAATAEITQDGTEVYRFRDFMNTNIVLKWAIEELLPVAGSMVIFGKPGIGKSTYALRLAMSLALGKDYFLKWKIVNPQRTLFLSLEMQHDELKQFFLDMEVSDEDSMKLQESFFVWPIGHAYPLDTPDQQIELLKYIDLHKIELIVIDSLSLSMYGSISDDNDIKRLNAFLNEDVRKARRCGYIFIHHPRKEGAEATRRDKNMDDAYGSTFIAANAQTVIILSQRAGSPRVTVHMEKARHKREEKEKFEIERTPDRGFKLANETPSSDAISLDRATDIVVGRKAESDKSGNVSSLGRLWNV
jgi:hypothetical protein